MPTDSTTQPTPAPAISKDDVSAAADAFLKDPATGAYFDKDGVPLTKWGKIFFAAPPAAQNRIALNFWVTQFGDKPGFDRDVYLALRDRLERGMKRDDIEYMILNSENESAKRHFRKMLLALPDDDGAAALAPTSAKEGGES